jgi:hypothetical protein
MKVDSLGELKSAFAAWRRTKKHRTIKAGVRSARSLNDRVLGGVCSLWACRLPASP